jgi:hypothetical protein
MQGRAQRIVGEALFPHPRREFMHARSRMLTHALQHIDQVIVGIDVMQLARHQQALRDADLLGTELGPAEHPVLFAHWDGAQCALQ